MGAIPGYDARINLHIGGESVSLLIEAKRTVYPGMYAKSYGGSRALYGSRVSAGWGEGAAASPHCRGINLSGRKRAASRGAGRIFRQRGSLFVPGRSIYVYIEKAPPKPF